MAAQKFPFLSTLIRETSADWKPSLLIGLPIQIISLLQLTYVILQPVSQQYLNIQLSCLDILQKISSVTSAFAETGLLDSNGIVELVWVISIIYFLVHVALIIRIFFKSRKLKPRNERFPNFHTILYLLHARIIFFPLHYYFLWFIKTFTENLDDSGGRLSGYGVAGLAITVVLAACNIILAIFKEFFSYQIRKSKDALATKNNLNSKTILLHKGIHLVLILFITGDIKEPFITLLNLLISGFCLWDLFFRLSFYNLAILKLNLVFTVCHAVLSLVFALDLINIGKQYSEIILFVILPLTSKIVLKYFNKIITRLSRLEFKTPEEAAHSLVLMKRYLGLESNVMSSLEKSQKALVFQYGMLKLYANDISKAPKEENILEPSQQIYMVFLRKCQALYKRCPSSELLQILMAQTYISKINNTAIGLSFVNKLKFNASIPAQRSVQNIHRKLERVYFRAYLEEEDKLEALKYFENRDFANALKSSLQNEILEHLKLWKELIHEQVDVKTVLDTAENIEEMAKKVNKIWSDPSKDTQKTFGALFLMYGTFLDIVRGNHHERASMMLKYSSIMKSKDGTKRITSPFSEDVAVMLISVEVDKLGRVVDASSSVKDIFKIEKEKLIGQKLDNLMPRNVARVHDYFLEKNNRLGIHSVHRDFDTYAKTISGNFFQIHLDVRVCPSLAKGLNLMGKVKKLRNEELVVLVNQQGILVDCSRDLFETFKITPKDFDRTKIVDLCPDFLAVHHSFNIVYCGEPEINLTYLDDRSFIVPDKDNADTGIEHNLRKLKSQPMKLLSLKSTEDKFKSDDSEAFGSPAGTVSTKKSTNPNQLNPGMKFFTKLRLPTFLQEGVVDDPEQKGGNITFPTMITKEKAQEIVERFKTGVKLNFYSLAREKNSRATGEKIEYQVIMEHFILNGEHYKIIKLKNFRVEEKIINFLRGDAALTNFNKAMKETPIQDSLSPMNALLRTKETLTKMKTDENNFEAMRKLTSMRKDEKRKTLAHAIENKGNMPVPSKQEIKPAFQRLSPPRSQRHAASSTFSKSSGSSEAQTTKILSKLYQARSMRPVTTFAVFIVYFSMLVVFVLATIDYFFSNQSITDLQAGMLVVDTANRRLINTIVAWQWVLIVYARSVGIRAIVPSFITGSMGIIRNRTLQMISENAELKMRLEDINQEEFIKAFYVKDIPFYEPSSGLLFDSDYIDGFTATKVLSTKYFDFSNFTQSVLLLNNTDYVLFVMNNTANGFLLRCEAEISRAESILANITETNKNLLVVLLMIQILSLAFVLISLLYLVRVVFLSYIRLFRALTRIKESDILGRISHLEAIFNCLNENIESKNFSDKLEECFDDLMYPTKKPSKKAKIKKSGFQEENFTFRSLIIQTVKYLSVSIVLLLALIALFSVSFVKSTNSFKTLQTLNSQISLAHRLGYAFDMLLPIFYFFIIFQSYPNYLIRNQSPWVQLENLLPYLARANNMLLDSLSDPEYGFGDAVLEDFFTRNFCNYVQSSATSNCTLASKGGVMGFSELNTQYYNSHVYWLGVYLEDPNYAHAKTILVPYAIEIVNDITIIEDCYRFLADHLLSLFNNETDNKNKESSTMFIVVLLSIFLSTIIIQSITINKFKKNDLVTKKILKIIPISIIQQNKILGAFLMNEYKGELHGVRRYLQSS